MLDTEKKKSFAMKYYGFIVLILLCLFLNEKFKVRNSYFKFFHLRQLLGTINVFLILANRNNFCNMISLCQYARPVEFRHEFLRRRAALLHIAACDSNIERVIDNGLVFEGRERSIHALDLRCAIHRRILSHQRQYHLVAECLPKPIEDSHAFLPFPRQDQMTYQYAAFEDSILP